jgi:hypothetical protein
LTVNNYNRKKILIKSIFFIFLLAFLGYFVQAETTVDFDSVEINRDREQYIRINSDGNMTLKIDNINLKKNNGDFSIECDSSLSIAAGEAIDIPVKFQPCSPGKKIDTLIIESNDSNQKRKMIILKGKAIAESSNPGSLADDNPEEFALAQNYPNPFNSSTTFKFQIPETRRINITIYSITGQKIKSLSNKTRSPGYYEVRWNGTNEFGQKVSSGLYLARMRAGNFAKNILLTYAK